MSEYALKLSEAELERYQRMAEMAAMSEGELWRAAGIVEGAAVADVGCGPGATSAVLGRLVGPAGSVKAVDRDPAAVEAARETVDRAGLTNVTLSVGDADDTGLEPGSVDAVMIRHVLGHNQAKEQAVVDHAATLVRPGGSVYLVDVDHSAVRTWPPLPHFEELNQRYEQWHAQQGNDLRSGLRLGQLLTTAGLEDVQHQGRYLIFAIPPGLRMPAWAARDALVAAGLATQDDLDRWEADLNRADLVEARPTAFIPQFLAFGRRPAG